MGSSYYGARTQVMGSVRDQPEIKGARPNDSKSADPEFWCPWWLFTPELLICDPTLFAWGEALKTLINGLSEGSLASSEGGLTVRALDQEGGSKWPLGCLWLWIECNFSVYQISWVCLGARPQIKTLLAWGYAFIWEVLTNAVAGCRGYWSGGVSQRLTTAF